MKRTVMKSTFLAFIFLLFFVISAIDAVASGIGIGDEVRITVYEHPDLSTVTRVSDNGKISFPLIGQIVLLGLSEREAETKISGLLQQGNFVRSPQVSVIVQNYLSRQSSVLGAVNRPGKYRIERENSLVDIISQAGGLSAQAGDTVIVIKKNNNQRIRIDLIDFFMDTGKQTNLTFSDGDIIYVPKMDVFYIYGEVQRPGSYRLERNMNVMQALSVGGSLTSRGTLRGLLIKRKDKDGNVNEISAKQTDVLLPNDVIYIKKSLF